MECFHRVSLLHHLSTRIIGLSTLQVSCNWGSQKTIRRSEAKLLTQPQNGRQELPVLVAKRDQNRLLKRTRRVVWSWLQKVVPVFPFVRSVCCAESRFFFPFGDGERFCLNVFKCFFLIVFNCRWNVFLEESNSQKRNPGS